MTTLRELKTGAALHVLVALMINGASTNDQLRHLTGWSAEAVADATNYLKQPPNDLIWPHANGRHPLWSLSDNGRAFLAAAMDKAVDAPGRMSPLAADSTGGGGRLENTPCIESNVLLLPVSPLAADSPAGNVDNPPSLVESPAGDLVVNQLTRLGCTPKRAAKAINKALRRGERPPDIARRIAHLTAYIKTQHLRQPGEWAAQFIEAGTDLPALPDRTNAADKYAGYRPYLANSNEDPDHD